jgi:hypothetical protein
MRVAFWPLGAKGPVYGAWGPWDEQVVMLDAA